MGFKIRWEKTNLQFFEGLKVAFHCYNFFISKDIAYSMRNFEEKATRCINGKKNIRLVKSGENYSFFQKPEVSHLAYGLGHYIL